MQQITESLADDPKHTDACHERWCERQNRRMGDPEYKDEWYAEQCFNCRYFIPLVGALKDDWGVCSNPEAPFDGTVRFEHDGCELHSYADIQWTAKPDEPQELWDRHKLIQQNTLVEQWEAPGSNGPPDMQWLYADLQPSPHVGE